MKYVQASLFLGFLAILFARSLTFFVRTVSEFNLPIYQTRKIDSRICLINASTVPTKDYHLFWYYRLGMNCKDYCE